MKKSHYNELLNDLKAAVRLGHPESVEIALDGFRSHPVIAANERLSQGIIAQLILPAGKILTRLSTIQLSQLLGDPLTSLRAMAAAALARQFVSGEEVDLKLLQAGAGDSRPEVRTALAQTLREEGEAHPERILPLAEAWLTADSARVRNTALAFIPALTPTYSQTIFQYLQAFKEEEHPEVQAALVAALQALAQRDLAEPVLALLINWGTEPHPNLWVISKTISASWAASYSTEVESLLQTLHAKVGNRKQITNTLKALQRHGLNIEL
jgi:hypothetical protein